MSSLHNVAYHEAGHCIVARHFGFALLYVSIQREPDRLGYMKWIEGSPRSLGACRDNMVISSAGVAAEYLFNPKLQPPLAGTDLDDCHRMANLMYGMAGSIEMKEAEIAAAMPRAIEILRAKWSAVVELAEALVAAQRVVERHDLAGYSDPTAFAFLQPSTAAVSP